MVGISSDDNWRDRMLFRNATDIFPETVANFRCKKRCTVLGAENEMDVI